MQKLLLCSDKSNEGVNEDEDQFSDDEFDL